MLQGFNYTIFKSIFNHSRRNTSHNSIRWNVLGNNSPSSYDGTITDSNTSSNKSSLSYPNIISDVYLFKFIFNAFFVVFLKIVYESSHFFAFELNAPFPFEYMARSNSLNFVFYQANFDIWGNTTKSTNSVNMANYCITSP